MSTAAQLSPDQLASLTDAGTQRLAARMAQDVFTGVFRQAVAGDGAPDVGVLGEVASHCYNWCLAGGSDAARAARLALLISGLDQWGLAYTQAFGLTAIHPLTALIGGLRTRLDAQADNRFQKYFEQIDTVETDALDFKVELRRSIHLALWHAMAACESNSQVESIVQTLGSLLLALDQRMPELGWRLVADALANIQICLLSKSAPDSSAAQEGTQQLFASLRHAMPQERYQQIMAHAGQAVVAWQQAKRPADN